MISFEQQDLNGDTTPDKAIITASYMGGRYRVVIYDQGLDMQWSDDWRTGTDFINDVWLFQTENGEQTKLIIRFSQGPDGYLAELYDDFDGDGDVAYQIHNQTEVEILESSFPTMRMTADQPWLLPGGKVNYMARFTLQRPLPIWFMQIQYFQYLPQEGSIAYTNEVVDSDGDGNPDYELGLAFPTTPEDKHVFRSQINVNVSNVPRPNFEEAFFWPYLGYADTENWSEKQIQRRPENLSPPIKVDWQAGHIKGVAPFLPFYGLGNQWEILTTKPIEKNKINELDWEVFAYYDFTDDAVMDVLFRLLHQPVEPVRIGSKTLHLEQVSYAWHHQNRDTIKWDYELELAALHELPSTVVEFQDFAVYTIPYEDLLQHFSRPSDWAYATFVAAESGAYQSNEGIWEWGTLEGIQTDITLPPEERFVPGAMEAQHKYLRGMIDNSPADLYAEIREGFRGEYADLLGPVSLYFSSIDRRLHLSKAQKGLWNLGNNGEIQYKNLGGAYLDNWILIENGDPIKYLYASPGYLIYQDKDGVQLFQTDTPAALFTTFPPRDRTEWEELDAKLKEYQMDFVPDDFLAMAEQFSEPRLVISTTSIRDFRLTDGGFRFILTLGSNFVLTGEDLLGLNKLEPGEYVVTLTEGVFSVQTLSPARVTLVMEVNSGKDHLETLRVRITNEGLTDLPGIYPSFTQICNDRTQNFGDQAFDLDGGSSKVVSVLLPAITGQGCTLSAQLLDSEGLILAERSIEARPASDFDQQANQVLEVSSSGGHWLVVYLLLGVMGILFGAMAAKLPR